eukprot:UN10055
MYMIPLTLPTPRTLTEMFWTGRKPRGGEGNLTPTVNWIKRVGIAVFVYLKEARVISHSSDRCFLIIDIRRDGHTFFCLADRETNSYYFCARYRKLF